MNEQPKLSLRWRLFRAVFPIGLLLIAIPVVAIASFRFLHDWSNVPLCHKQVWAQCADWCDYKRTKELPNIDGNSDESLTKLLTQATDSQNTGEWNEKYQYVPGLKRGDPGDLVLMYMKQPTRWGTHASSPPWIFNEAKWMIVPLDFEFTFGPKDVQWVKREIPYKGECSERVSLVEFKERLRKTLKFLQDNNRPHCERVVSENEAILKSLKDANSRN